MSVRPYTRKKAKPGETWWLIDIGYGKSRVQIPFCGAFDDAKKAELSFREGSKRAPSLLKIKDMVVPFLEWYATESSPRTLRDIRFTMNLYIVPRFGALGVNQLTVAVFNQFKVDMLEQGLSPTTINKHLNYFSSLLRWAAENNHCLPLPFAIPKFPKKRLTPIEETKPLTARMVSAIYQHIDPDYRILYLLMVDHGLRLEEALNVKIEDIDESRQIISVLGKGNKRRQVPFMSRRFVEELEKIMATRFDGPLAINPETGTRYTTVWKGLKRAAVAAGVKMKINHHILRHTFASLAAEAGMNPHALQAILGHSSIETTNKIYTHVRRDFVGDEARMIMEKRGE